MGWGDMLFETLAFHSTVSGTYPSPESLPATFFRDEKYGFGYTGHFYAEYLYRCSRVVSVGIQADAEGIFWKEGRFDRYHKLTGAEVAVRNWDVVLMPTVRFTWLHTPWVRLYSGLGAGVLFAFDNARQLEAAPAFDVKPLGIQLGKTHWCGSLDFGFLSSMKSVNHIYMFGSRLVSVSVNYRW
jgi:hypothetical protein